MNVLAPTLADKAAISAANAAWASIEWAKWGVIATVVSDCLLLLTLLITALAVRAAQRSAKAAERAISVGEASLQQSREAAVWQLRAYVHLERIDFIPSVKGTQIQPVFKNVGLTPTRRAVCQINFYMGSDKLDESFNFPNPDHDPEPLILAAGQELAFSGPTISSRDLELVRSGGSKYYIYGWIEYNDVFKSTPRRRTEFCSKFEVGLGHWAFVNEPIFNGTDDECLHRPT